MGVGEDTGDGCSQPASTPMLAMGQLTAGCADSREVDQTATLRELLAQGEHVFTAGKPRYNSDPVIRGLHLWKASQRRRHLSWT